MIRVLLPAFGIVLMAACTTPGSDMPPPEDIERTEMDRDFKGMCDAAPAQDYVGKIIGERTGVEILKLSGARTLRWGPPDSAWTMDYREDRVNVRYDRAMTIEEITCG